MNKKKLNLLIILISPINLKKKKKFSYFHQKFYIGCVNHVEGKSAKNADNGPHGILENHCYGVLDIREVIIKNGMKFFYNLIIIQKQVSERGPQTYKNQKCLGTRWWMERSFLR